MGLESPRWNIELVTNNLRLTAWRLGSGPAIGLKEAGPQLHFIRWVIHERGT